MTIKKAIAMTAYLSLAIALNGGSVNAYTISDAVTNDQNIQFIWTKEGSQFPTTYRIQITGEGGNPFIFQKAPATSFDFRDEIPVLNGKAAKFTFFAPSGSTDWRQTIIGPDGSSEVFAGNIKKESPWIFEELDLLPNIVYRIPDLAPIAGDPSETIYTAVNLDLYINENPLGFLNGAWSIGQTLDDLGLEIISGEIPGLEGIFWATTPFEFDPNPFGRGFTPLGGDANLLDSSAFGFDIAILQQHFTVPEPSTISLFGLAIPILLWIKRRRFKSNDMRWVMRVDEWWYGVSPRGRRTGQVG